MAARYLALIYDLADDYLERRPEFREEHLVRSWRIRDWNVVVGG